MQLIVIWTVKNVAAMCHVVSSLYGQFLKKCTLQSLLLSPNFDASIVQEMPDIRTNAWASE